MKKLLLLLTALSSLAVADGFDCSKIAQTVVDKLAKHERTSATLTYSVDKTDQANACKAAILDKNKDLTINLKPTSGTNQFKFSK